ncbi:PD-(D/E)XK nuclease family protein [Anaerotruncus rubiinfantis]|uniref:PD-(D/E)XK nuclease family protein n=4 Tax=Anaerotruncus rubiinfantis TaxID=1720200 RepID=UPI00189BB0AC|nr:PD-(D/E)XK nuclease family protein [Anaerotruncus rubiinfantis]
MLDLILGIAGTGKTTLLHERIGQAVKNGRKAILIVPEQYSFESEKMLYRRLGAKDALSVEVLSFTRLCDRIFREFGGLAGVHLDETAKYLLMSVALGELRDGLSVYRRNAEDAALVASMCETVSELKTAGVEPEILRAVARDASGGLSDKLGDIALIFETYQALIEQGYTDPDDNLRRACKKLEEHPDFLEDYEVFIDGFMAFMGAEWRMLALLLEFCPRVTVTLTCEGPQAPGATGALSAPARTAHRLTEMAKRCGARVSPPVVMREPHRFQNPALAAVAREYPKLRPEISADTRDVFAISCEDLYDELEYIAAQIALLVREKGYRYRDIVVIGRSLERYLVPLETVFSRYDIPFFADQREDIQVYPLVSGVLGALEAVRGNFSTDAVLSLAKNCITGVDQVDAGLLENYCFTWGISGVTWVADFVNNPDGMVEGFTEEQTAALSRINAAREKLAGPLRKLMNRLENCDGRGFAGAVFQYLADCKAAEHLQESAQEMDLEEQKRFLETGAQVWDLLVGILDVFGGALGGTSFKLSRYIDLLRMSLAASDIGSLPQTLDQVIVGTADRIRPNGPRAAFIIGLNEGAFPLWDAPGGIFSPAERNLLKERGVDLLRTPEQYALFERYFVYFALTQASERLYMTWPMRDTAGGALAPSGALAQLRGILGDKIFGAPSFDDALGRAVNEKTAFDAMTRCWREDSVREATLKAYFAENAPRRMAQLESCSGAREFALYDRAAARRLFGREMRISPSKVERYYSCPFSYFCQVGLRLNTRRKAEFNPIESGSLIHLVLEKMVKKHGGRGLFVLPDAQLRAEVSELIEADLGAKIQNLEEMPARFKYLFRRLVNTLVRLLRRLGLEFSQSEFEPEAFELPINLDAQIKPLDLIAADGTKVIVEGIVDRVDVLRRGQKRYVRVVDYKSGRKTFNLSDVYYGLNLQMLIYLFSICENPLPDGAEPVPAGVLYMPARDSVISAGRHASDEEIRAEQLKRLKMNGILIEDREVLSAMEPDLAGVFIPAKAKKDGSFDVHSSLANLTQMAQIRRQVEKLLTEISSDLYGGRIGAKPADGLSDYSPCLWCDYHAVCGHEEGDPVRKLCEIDKERIYELMGKEDSDG